MVSNVNSYAYYQDPMVYAQHLAVPQHQDSLMSDVKSSLTMGGLLSIPQAIGAKNSHYATQDLVKHGTKLSNIPSAVANGTTTAWGKLTGGNFSDTFQTAKNVFKNHDAIEAATDIQNMIKAQAKAAKGATLTGAEVQKLQTLSNNLMDAARNGSDDVAKYIKEAEGIIAKSKAGAKTGVLTKYVKDPIKHVSSKATQKFVKTPTGKVVQEGVEKVAKGRVGSAVSKFAKVGKRCGIWFDLAIEGTMAIFSDIIPAFKNGGFKSGMKQIGKSSVQVGGSVAGFAAGAKGGAALGAAIGSVFPGAGTAIGGAIGGLVGGLLGSSLLSGIAKKITGKNESEKIAEQQEAQLAQQQVQAPTNQIATNQMGGYNFAVPTNLYPQIATNSYLA